MKIIVTRLLDTLEQKIRVGGRPIQVVAIRPHLYLNNWAAGSIELSIHLADETELVRTAPVNMAMVTSDPYFHGYVKFDVSYCLDSNTEYMIRLTKTFGSPFSATSYAGWCRDYDLRSTPTLYVPDAGMHSPFDVQVWEAKLPQRGIG